LVAEFADDDGAGAVVVAVGAELGLAVAALVGVGVAEVAAVAPVAAGIDSGEVMTGSGI
jgi:hypothetical protein